MTRITDEKLKELLHHTGTEIQLTLTNQLLRNILCEIRERRAEDLELDDYEAVNLLWLVDLARGIGLDTGDWLGQIRFKLDNRGHGSVRDPNSTPQDTEARLDSFARRRVGAAGPHGPIPMRLVCEDCGILHIDEGEFATKPHHTHACQHCGLVWRPAIVCTVGVQFLPGFKSEVK
jgi:hypothetical protein